ncbi:MAG: type II/IV secretion system ATPase subunit [Candidatus Thermoplasmatota archaeon]|nr:type II/IV secretion system ATPase subunit [Candidatus Thermoplasmatota archaeon]
MAGKKSRTIVSLKRDQIELTDSPTNDDLVFEELEQGLVYSRIYLNKKTGDMVYVLIEPAVDEKEKDAIGQIEDYIIALAAYNEAPAVDKKKEFDEYFNITIDDLGFLFDKNSLQVVRYYVERDIVGFGRIDGLMKDPGIEDISCDNANVPVFVYHRDFGYMQTNVRYNTESELNLFVKKMVQDSGKHISISIPILDATLVDGSRLQASYGRYITNNGPAFTIRKFRSNPLSPVSLVMSNTLSARAIAYLWVLTEYGSNMMVAGGTGSGKTTTLNAILLFIPPQMKVVSIEDTREINIPHENWIAAVTRPGFGKLNQATGKRAGEIDMFDLLTASLRQRPNYLIIGEVRGKEAFTVFQAMSAGRYGFGTFHAEDPRTLIYRLESSPINIPRTLITSLDVIIMQSALVYKNKIVRRTTSISEITGIDSGSNDIVINNVFKWNPQNDQFTFSGYSYVMNRIAERIGKTEQMLEKEVEQREKIITRMIKKRFITYKDVTRLVTLFYKDKSQLLKELDLTDEELQEEKDQFDLGL